MTGSKRVLALRVVLATARGAMPESRSRGIGEEYRSIVIVRANAGRFNG